MSGPVGERSKSRDQSSGTEGVHTREGSRQGRDPGRGEIKIGEGSEQVRATYRGTSKQGRFAVREVI